ncbi:type II secretion system F family protein [Angustibacter peucedani]
MNPLWQGVALGGLLGVGLWLVVAGLPWLRRPDLDSRLAPYVQDVVRPSGLLSGPTGQPDSVVIRLLAPVLHDVSGWVGRLLGGAPSVRRRLERAGLPPDVDGFRAQQVLWGVVGLAIGGTAAAAVWWRGAAAVLPLLVLVLVCGGTGVAARDWWLSQQAERREQQMLAEFPTVAELLALAVGAGEGPVAALDRVARLSQGELSTELRRTLADARAGASLVQALQGLSDRTGLVPLQRFVDGVVVAVERGTPLADVLRAQAQDVRAAGRRALMDSAGRKEIAMMVPVVFGVLPVTVLFAVYPGFAFLRLGV